MLKDSLASNHDHCIKIMTSYTPLNQVFNCIISMITFETSTNLNRQMKKGRKEGKVKSEGEIASYS